MKKLFLTGLLVLVALGSGCSMLGLPSGDVAAQTFEKTAANYYNQTRVFVPVEISGLTYMSIMGTNITVKTEAPLNQLSVLQRNNELLGKGIDAAKSLGLGYIAGKVMVDANKRPQVVPIRPEVVQPEVIFAP